MRTLKNYKNWMAEEIAKTYLLATGLIDINKSSDKNYDLFAMPKQDFNKRIGIDIKASQYSKSEILKEYKKTRESYVNTNIPVIMFYINAMDKTGLIEVIDNKLTDDLISLSTDSLTKEINKITNKNYEVA